MLGLWKTELFVPKSMSMLAAQQFSKLRCLTPYSELMCDVRHMF